MMITLLPIKYHNLENHKEIDFHTIITEKTGKHTEFLLDFLTNNLFLCIPFYNLPANIKHLVRLFIVIDVLH